MWENNGNIFTNELGGQHCKFQDYKLITFYHLCSTYTYSFLHNHLILIHTWKSNIFNTYGVFLKIELFNTLY